MKWVLSLGVAFLVSFPVTMPAAWADDAPAAPEASAPPAPSLASLVEAIRTEEANVGRLRVEADAAVRPNGALEAERKIYEAQMSTRLLPIQTKIVADLAQLKSDVARHNAGVDKSSANCTGELPQAALDRCQGEKRHWDASKAVLDGRKSALENRAKDYDKSVLVYANRLARIAAEIAANKKTAELAQRKIAETEARIRELKALLVEACKAPGDLEALKYCNDISWSGANPNLPPLRRPRPPLVITPNK